MNDLQKQFEATGYASWINSELYPDGQIYTKEYTEWLERQLQAKQTAPQNEKIIQSIAAYLEQKTTTAGYHRRFFFVDNSCQEIAREIAAAIAPHLEAGAGWEDAPEWAEWRTVDKGGAITFWDKEPRLSHAGYWTMQGTDGTKWEEVGQDESWKHSLQSRPR